MPTRSATITVPEQPPALNDAPGAASALLALLRSLTASAASPEQLEEVET
jgi:hypothetical protein